MSIANLTQTGELLSVYRSRLNDGQVKCYVTLVHIDAY